MKIEHVCIDVTLQRPCLEVLRVEDFLEWDEAYETYSKCADCCLVLTCEVCGPCEAHDKYTDTTRDSTTNKRIQE